MAGCWEGGCGGGVEGDGAVVRSCLLDVIMYHFLAFGGFAAWRFEEIDFVLIWSCMYLCRGKEL